MFFSVYHVRAAEHNSRGKNFLGLLTYLLRRDAEHRQQPGVPIGGTVCGTTARDIARELRSAAQQRPDITKPAGAGDVPLANYKMIGALAVKRGELDRKELADFTKKHGLTGWAPTQGHIPSGVPYIGVAREDILEGKIKNAMIIGKGSLFLGRMTNLFDGVSFVIHGNTADQEKKESGVSEEEVKGLIAKAMKEFAAALLAE